MTSKARSLHSTPNSAMTGPLYRLQKEHGAQMQRFGEWELPADYGDWGREHDAVLLRAGLIDRTARALIEVTGEDRYSWLQGMVSNDVRRLEAGADAISACILNYTGHLLSDLVIVRNRDALLLDLPWENGKKIFDVLDQFLIVEDV